MPELDIAKLNLYRANDAFNLIRKLGIIAFETNDRESFNAMKTVFPTLSWANNEWLYNINKNQLLFLKSTRNIQNLLTCYLNSANVSNNNANMQDDIDKFRSNYKSSFEAQIEAKPELQEAKPELQNDDFTELLFNAIKMRIESLGYNITSLRGHLFKDSEKRNGWAREHLVPVMQANYSSALLLHKFNEAKDQANNDVNLFANKFTSLIKRTVASKYGVNENNLKPQSYYIGDEDLKLIEKNSVIPITLDLRTGSANLKERIATIPEGVTKVIFPMYKLEYDDYPKIYSLLSYLPPHIKHIEFPCTHHRGEYFMDHENHARIARHLPRTLDSAIIGHPQEGIPSYFETKDFLQPNYPPSYSQVFNKGATGVKGPLIDAELVYGIKALLDYYLGVDNRGNDKPFFSNPLRSSFRDHRRQVREVLDSITDQDTPLEILYRLKNIEPTNQKGGLRMRINFIHERIAENDNLKLASQPGTSHSI